MIGPLAGLIASGSGLVMSIPSMIQQTVLEKERLKTEREIAKARVQIEAQRAKMWTWLAVAGLGILVLVRLMRRR